MAVIAAARESASTWEHSSKSRRIVTTTRIEVQQSLDGRAPTDSHLYVRTLGGKVGEIGQIVHGEAELHRDKSAVFFLHEAIDGAYRITAMSQGHFGLIPDREGTFRLAPSPQLAEFVSRDPRSAVNRLRGKTISACEQLIIEALESGR
jgi:hypothetical protein